MLKAQSQSYLNVCFDLAAVVYTYDERHAQHCHHNRIAPPYEIVTIEQRLIKSVDGVCKQRMAREEGAKEHWERIESLQWGTETAS